MAELKLAVQKALEKQDELTMALDLLRCELERRGLVNKRLTTALHSGNMEE
jgi:hypothetical protein